MKQLKWQNFIMEKYIHAWEPIRQINGHFNNQVRKINKIYQVGCSESLIIKFFQNIIQTYTIFQRARCQRLLKK